jgi:hypothetical protein
MNKGWLCLLLASSFSWASAPSEPEATPKMIARRAKACRADLSDYQSAPSVDLMDRLIACLDHPDAKLRAEILDRLPDRRLWSRFDYDVAVLPRMQDLLERSRDDPDGKVRLHASQLDSWLSNADEWLSKSSASARERRRARRSQHRRGPPVWLAILVFLCLIAIVAWSVVSRYSPRRSKP